MTKRQQNLLAIVLLTFFIPYLLFDFYVHGFRSTDLLYLVAAIAGACWGAWIRARNIRRAGQDRKIQTETLPPLR